MREELENFCIFMVTNNVEENIDVFYDDRNTAKK